MIFLKYGLLLQSGFLLWGFQAQAAPLKEILNIPLSSVALYIGTFDPLHLGHEKIIEQVLRLELADAIIVAPVEVPLNKPHASSFAFRRQVVADRYKDDSRVFVPEYSQKELGHPMAITEWLRNTRFAAHLPSPDSLAVSPLSEA